MPGAKSPAKIRITLTDEQATQVKAAIGRQAEAIELTVHELEQRIAPSGASDGGTSGLPGWRLALNCNETLLV
jgi:hypothetical protein